MSVAKPKKARTQNKDRLNFRLDPEIKARVARAAAISGQGLTDFAVSTLSERADVILERHDSLLISSEDYEFFLNSLEGHRKPSSRSRAAAQRYRRGQRTGVRFRLAD